MNKIYYLICVCFGLAACSADLAPIEGCEALGGIRPVCGMNPPEDIAALADGKHLLLSNFGGMHDATGKLSLFDTETEALTTLFPPPSGTIASSAEQWGQANCPAPTLENFSPHGTHLHRLADGRWRYLVVNHGGRESIELFELTMAGNETSLAWRGCVLAAEDTYMNDVVGLANGDLIFSRMLHHGGDFELLKATLGFVTGDLWRWNRTTGLRV